MILLFVIKYFPLDFYVFVDIDAKDAITFTVLQVCFCKLLTSYLFLFVPWVVCKLLTFCFSEFCLFLFVIQVIRLISHHYVIQSLLCTAWACMWEWEPGRHLGLQFDKKSGDLYICDCYFGLMKVCQLSNWFHVFSFYCNLHMNLLMVY